MAHTAMPYNVISYEILDIPMHYRFARDTSILTSALLRLFPSDFSFVAETVPTVMLVASFVDIEYLTSLMPHSRSSALISILKCQKEPQRYTNKTNILMES